MVATGVGDGESRGQKGDESGQGSSPCPTVAPTELEQLQQPMS